jgi:hypothetical protein
VIPLLVLLLLPVPAAGADPMVHGASIPVCSNRVINEVVKRSGCTVGDTRCWLSSGGMCTDYVEKRIGTGRSLKALGLESIRPEEVRRGDVAVFLGRVHYAYVEGVAKDKDGRPVAVELSEFNFGTCWVDREGLVTDQYKVVNRRSGVPLGAVDGGFLGRRPATR